MMQKQIEVTVNDVLSVFIAPITLFELIGQLGLPVHATAIALNQEITPRSLWQQTHLSNGDQISLFQAIAGG